MTSLFMKWGRALDKVRRYEKENFQIVTILLNVELSWKPLEKRIVFSYRRTMWENRKEEKLNRMLMHQMMGENDEKNKKCKPNLEIGISYSHYLTNMDI